MEWHHPLRALRRVHRVGRPQVKPGGYGQPRGRSAACSRPIGPQHPGRMPISLDHDFEHGGTMSGDLLQLTRRLSPGAVVTDDEITEGYRRDRAATVPAGR